VAKKKKKKSRRKVTTEGKLKCEVVNIRGSGRRKICRNKLGQIKKNQCV